MLLHILILKGQGRGDAVDYFFLGEIKWSFICLISWSAAVAAGNESFTDRLYCNRYVVVGKSGLMDIELYIHQTGNPHYFNWTELNPIELGEVPWKLS